jgi:hypothetical protein
MELVNLFVTVLLVRQRLVNYRVQRRATVMGCQNKDGNMYCVTAEYIFLYNEMRLKMLLC